MIEYHLAYDCFIASSSWTCADTVVDHKTELRIDNKVRGCDGRRPFTTSQGPIHKKCKGQYSSGIVVFASARRATYDDKNISTASFPFCHFVPAPRPICVSSLNAVHTLTHTHTHTHTRVMCLVSTTRDCA